MIQQLRNIGITQKVIQEVTGISERTIRRIQNEPALTETNDLIFRKSRNAGRPRVVLQKLFKIELSYQSALVKLPLRRFETRILCEPKHLLFRLLPPVLSLTCSSPRILLRFVVLY